MKCILTGVELNKKYWVSVGISFAFIFGYEWLVHEVLLGGMYESTAALWRSKEEMVCSAMILAQLFFPIMAALIFVKGYENKGLGEGVRFGILLGLLFVPFHLAFYAVMPIPVELLIAWIVAGFVEMIGMGVIFAKVYGCQK